MYIPSIYSCYCLLLSVLSDSTVLRFFEGGGGSGGTDVIFAVVVLYTSWSFSQWQNSVKSSQVGSWVRVQINNRHKKNHPVHLSLLSAQEDFIEYNMIFGLSCFIPSVYSKSTQTTPNHTINNHFSTYKNIKLQGKENRNDTTYTVFIQTQPKVFPLYSIFKYVESP
jgi:hypothetical protein